MRLILSLLAATALTAPAASAASILDGARFHVGVNGGWLDGTSTQDLYDWEGSDAGVVHKDDTAFFIGAQAGVDFTFGRYFLGVETDYAATDYSAQTPHFPEDQEAVGQDIDGFGTIRVRAGGTVCDGTRLFASAGYAYTREQVRLKDEPTHFSDIDDVMGTGWAWGLGFDHMLDEHWALRAEYLHVHTKSDAHTHFIDEDEDYFSHNKFDAGMVRLGADYDF